MTGPRAIKLREKLALFGDRWAPKVVAELNGYPFKLVGDQIPFIARIVAVADAYDAMTGDRPYRPGMPVERVDQIFRNGAGHQWDPEVVKAYFLAREDIRAIAGEERANLTLDVQQWT